METPGTVSSPLEDPPAGIPDHHISDDCIHELADLFDQSPNIFIRCDENGRLLYANRVSVPLFNADKILHGPLLQPCRHAVETKTSQACEATFNFERYLFVIVPDFDKKRVSIHGKELASNPDAAATRLKAAMACLEKRNRILQCCWSRPRNLTPLARLREVSSGISAAS